VVIAPATFDKLCRARDLLLLRDEASAANIACAVGLSRAHFIRQFEALFGATPHRFRTRERLDRARRLLAAGMSVTDTCLEVGFSS
jgi:AraC-like DNA-binding protein